MVRASSSASSTASAAVDARTDLFGVETNVLRVKGSGWDLATIEPKGLPAVRLEPLLKLEQLERLTDEAMVNYLRVCLMDASAPTPSR